MNREEFERVMTKVVDGVATPMEVAALETHLEAHPQLAAEYRRQAGLKALTDSWVQRLEGDLIEDSFNATKQTRVETRVGWSLFIIGTGLLFGGGIWAAIADPTAPLWLKIGIGSLAAGLCILFLSVVRWKRATSKHNAYKEIVR